MPRLVISAPVRHILEMFPGGLERVRGQSENVDLTCRICRRRIVARESDPVSVSVAPGLSGETVVTFAHAACAPSEISTDLVGKGLDATEPPDPEAQRTAYRLRLLEVAGYPQPELSPQARDAAFVRTSDWIKAHGFQVGQIDRSDAVGFLESATRRWMDELASMAASYDAEAVLRRLLEANELVLRSHAILREVGDSGEPVAELARAALAPRGEQSIALRALVELLSARQPTGSDVDVPESLLETLWAGAVQFLNLGHLRDEIAGGISGARLIENEAGWLEFDANRQLEEASEAHVLTSLAEESHLDALAEGPEERLWAAVDAAFAEEKGYGLDDLLTVLVMLMEAAEHLEDPFVVRVEAEVLVRAVSALLGAPEEMGRRALESLSLTSVKRYGDPDHVPWRFRRDRSLLRRPVVRVGPHGVVALWTWMPTRTAINDWGKRVHGQQVAADTPALRRALGRINNVRTNAFAEAVETFFRTDLRLRARRLQRLPADPNSTLGDVDVMVIAPAVKLVALIEAKANAPAQTPQQLRRELERLRPGERATGGTDVDRVLRRERHVRRHLAPTIATFGVHVDDVEAWRVCSAFVYERAVWAARVESPPVPVVSFGELRALPDLEAWLDGLARQ